MGIPENYICNDCGETTEFWKKSILDDFPKNVKCEHCKSKNTRRKWGARYFDIGQGSVGNYKDGYTGDSITYQPSSLTGFVKGTKIKK